MYKVYLFRQLEMLSREWLDRAVVLLPWERRHKAMRYRQIRDRKNCVVAYFMLKAALKECFGIREFELGYGDYGKPYLKDCPRVHFNFSHCGKACGVIVADEPVGIDVEEIRPFSWEIAGRVCSQQEFRVLEACGERDRSREFIRMWTMKESYVKRFGYGIGYDVRRVDTARETGFRMMEDEEIVVCVYGDRLC